MPSRYKRKPGSRRYIDYSKEKLEECLNMVRNRQLSQRAAAEQYQIARSTIKNKLRDKHPNKPGRPTIFTEEEERSFVAHIMALSEFGFPLTNIDLKFIIRDHLTAKGRTVSQFKNNVPGNEWLRCFLHRHNELSQRMANNIKKVRAQVSEKLIEDFIENLGSELENVPPENIYNYDETNLSDDPGKKKVICRRGSKYPESIVNSSKLSYSVMFCGNASGDVIAPYVIYKADHLWTTWTENGPPGARYNRTKSGWMDAATFEDWFINHLMPVLKGQEGRKVVIGDNLSSHINQRVVKECEKYNTAFICLPANSTHILQPLDVAYFRPLKLKWRQALLDWKQSPEGRRLTTTPKDQFPALLKTALDNLTSTRENIIAGFKKTGIMPLNKNEPIDRLPKQDRIANFDLITESFMQRLEQARNEINPATKIAKKRRLNVPAGRSITTADIADAGSSGMTPKSVTKKTKNKNVRAKRGQLHDDSTTSCSSNMSDVSSTEDLPDDVYGGIEDILDEQELLKLDLQLSPQNIHLDERIAINDDTNTISSSQFVDLSAEETKDDLPLASITKSKPNSGIKDFIQVDDHVLMKWEGQLYPGKVISFHEEGVMVGAMKKGVKFWRWPLLKDEQLYRWEDIVRRINPPKFMKKGCFSVPEIDEHSLNAV